MVSLIVVLSMMLSGLALTGSAKSEVASPAGLADEPAPAPTATDFPFRTTYPSIATLYAWYDTLVAEYPGLVTKIDIGNSFQGRDMLVLKITSDEEGVIGDKPDVLVEANIHAREWSTSNAAAYFAWLLLYNYDTNQTIHWLVNNREIYILPMVNPDGYYYDGDGGTPPGDMWRKNRNGTGVDLNRNWDIDWVNGDYDPSSETYHGGAPFSEYETKCIRNFMLAYGIDSFQCIHSYAGVLLIPWCYTPNHCPHDTWYRGTAAKMTSLTSLYGNPGSHYDYGQAEEMIGYNAPGGSIDWIYEAMGAQGFCFELETGGAGFYPGTGAIMTIDTDVDDALIYQARIADTDIGDGTANLFPPVPYIVYGNIYSGTSPIVGTPVTITNTATSESISIPTDSNGYYELDFGRLTEDGYTTAQTFSIAVGLSSLNFTIDLSWGKRVDMNFPSAPTSLTVDHWGIAANIETRYLTTTPTTVNSLAANSLNLTQSSTAGYYQTSTTVGRDTYAGIRVWKRNTSGTETELTSGTAVATAGRISNGAGLLAAAYTPPVTVLNSGDSVVVRLYVATSVANLTVVRAVFTTEQLSPGTLDAHEWTVSYYIRRGLGSSYGIIGSYCAWGTGLFNTNIAGFKYSIAGTPPTDHNTLNWTHPGTNISYYKVYRADTETGAYMLIDTVPVWVNTFVDSWKGQADTTLWWYIVRAVSSIGLQESNTNAVQEPAFGTLYSINLTEKPVGWVFVSYPVEVTGDIQTILNDPQTTWDIAKWYNPQTPADPWKTYRVGGTANDLTAINNKLGLWLHLSANGGDQMLTLSASGPYPASAVTVNLYTGWNLVGYPSATARLGSATLPAQADRVSVWQAAAPYITDSTPASVTMSHGNGYWVHVTADCTWTIFP